LLALLELSQAQLLAVFSASHFGGRQLVPARVGSTTISVATVLMIPIIKTDYRISNPVAAIGNLEKKRRPAEANRHLPVNSRPLIELLTIGGHDRQQ
jgi:hypothetical protein